MRCPQDVNTFYNLEGLTDQKPLDGFGVIPSPAIKPFRFYNHRCSPPR